MSTSEYTHAETCERLAATIVDVVKKLDDIDTRIRNVDESEAGGAELLELLEATLASYTSTLTALADSLDILDERGPENTRPELLEMVNQGLDVVAVVLR